MCSCDFFLGNCLDYLAWVIFTNTLPNLPKLIHISDQILKSQYLLLFDLIDDRDVYVIFTAQMHTSESFNYDFDYLDLLKSTVTK